MLGQIRKLVSEKGFGFVRGTDGHEYFFHRSALERGQVPFDQLQEGQSCEFEADPDSPKGPRAISLRLT